MKILIQYNNNQTLRKCWQIDDSMGIQANVNSQNRLILLHIKGTSGFLPREKVIYQAGRLFNKNYHGHINSASFTMVVNKVNPHLPPNVLLLQVTHLITCMKTVNPPKPYTLK